MKRFAAVLALSVFLAFPSISPASDNERTLTVRGWATADAAPDMAVVTVAVETMARGAKESAAANARTSDSVIKAIRKALAPTDEVDTASFSVFPVYEFEKDRGQVLKGFRTVHQVKVTTNKTSAAGEILDRAIEAGANRVVEVRYDLKDISAHCDGLIRSAAEKAAAQARAASLAFGTGLDVVKTIMPSCNKESEGPIRPYAMEAMKMRAPDTPIEPGTVRLRADVEAVYFLGGEK